MGTAPSSPASGTQHERSVRQAGGGADALAGLGQQHRAEDGGMIIAVERWNAGLDTAEMFADLPGGACQEPHWGYVLKGSVTLRHPSTAIGTAVGQERGAPVGVSGWWASHAASHCSTAGAKSAGL